MPEPVEQPAAASAKVLAKIKQKYRLDAKVDIGKAGPDGKPLGVGPLMSDEVFNKLASIDPTRDKRYLDWMLYQAGGTADALKTARYNWGIGQPEVNPDKLIPRFLAEPALSRLSREEIAEAVKKLNCPAMPNLTDRINQITTGDAQMTEKFTQMVALLQQNAQRVPFPPGKEGKIAGELLSFRIKKWARKQEDVKVRDRVHLLFVWNKMLRGMSAQEAEELWIPQGLKKLREYTYGDEDSIKVTSFGFARNWPGKEGIYDKVYSAVGTFLRNKTMVERRNTRLEQTNQEISARNAALPPDRQIALRQAIELPMNIGKVTQTKDLNLVYRGDFPKLSDLENVNKQMEDLPLRERVIGDIRYAGHEKSGPGERLYSDENLEMMVPITVAASIQGGHPSWDISNPNQLDDLTGTQSRYRLSAWTQHHAGLDAYQGAGEAGMAHFKKISAFIHVKLPMDSELTRIMARTTVDKLASLDASYTGITFRVGGEAEEMDFRSLLAKWRQVLQPEAYAKLSRSLVKALRVLRTWGVEYNSEQVVVDPVEHHRRAMTARRPTIREQAHLRALQTVNLLIE